MAAPDLTAHYASYYGSADLAAWRELGARDKAEMILALTEGLFSQPPRVADIGCGDGSVMATLDQHHFAAELVGFEVSASGAEAARRRDFGVPCRVELYDGYHIPADTGEFDLVVVSHVLEHVENPRGFLSEAARIGRYVLVEVPLELHARTPHDFQWTEVGHINLFNSRLLRHLVQSLGLRIERELIATSGREVQQYLRPGVRGDLRWLVKRGLLGISPRLATKLLTYNGALVASHDEPRQR